MEHTEEADPSRTKKILVPKLSLVDERKGKEAVEQRRRRSLFP